MDVDYSDVPTIRSYWDGRLHHVIDRNGDLMLIESFDGDRWFLAFKEKGITWDYMGDFDWDRLRVIEAYETPERKTERLLSDLRKAGVM